MGIARPGSIEDLWRSQPTADRPFDPDALTQLPPLARHYLTGAIAPGTPLASAVRLWMHGHIKLGQKWHPFRGEEVICWERGMIWRATAWMQGLPIVGADRVVDGVGAMQWKMLGLFPVMSASGADVTRSAIGRMQGESAWLPSGLCDPGVVWTVLDGSQVQASFTTLGESTQLRLTVDDQGQLTQSIFKRWGSPDGGDYCPVEFGVIIQERGTFGGYTIPTRIRAGWFLGSDRFESAGEFFHCTIDRASYR
jgi:hypothetical protein